MDQDADRGQLPHRHCHIAGNTWSPGLEEAQREIARLRELVQINAQSALLHAMRASARQIDAQRRDAQIQLIYRSTSWRVTGPLRMAKFLATRGPTVALRTCRLLGLSLWTYGLLGTIKWVRRRLSTGARRQISAKAFDATQNPIYCMPVHHTAATIVAPRVLIIAELSMPQCARYRVWQKKEHFALQKTACTVINWWNVEECRSAIQIYPIVIFYRVPGFPEVLSLVEEAKRLKVTTYWEVDDLIFDNEQYRKNRNLATLEPALRSEVLSGVRLFRKAMLACERTIASTEILADLMGAAGAGPTHVIENSLDAETLSIAAAIRARTPRHLHGSVMIAYGSGSKAHDADFANAASAIAELMLCRPEVCLRIVGELVIPAALQPFLDRIEKLPLTDYPAYLKLLGDADIAVAPLEPSVFNDAKSNIKFIEASILGLPSVCSPRSCFRSIVVDGENGFLAESNTEWLNSLARLVDDESLRIRLGAAALQTVTARYAPDVIAASQVRSLIAGLDLRRRPSLRLLVVNIFFAPRSFGGATIVAEEMAKRLHEMPDTDVFVFTSRVGSSVQYTLRRYDHDGIPVISVHLPSQNDSIADFDNPEMADVFADVLRAIEPDVVHFHSLQGLSASIVRPCQEMHIPYIVTVHDAWWLCPRQFMVRQDGAYCFQTKINQDVCKACMPEARHLEQRFRILQQRLAGAAFILSPSESHRRLHTANGLPADRVLVHRNGIRMPVGSRRRRGSRVVRFGYVGGTATLKGFHLVRRAFEEIVESNYELVIVDNTLNLGFSSIDTSDWHIRGGIEVVPAFGQAELDGFFETLDVLLFPSQWKESFGLIVAEALARDVWVVVTEGGGAAEFVVDGENGTIIPLVNDPRPLRNAILELLSDWQRLSGHLNPHKRLLHTYETQADELRGILNRACGRKELCGDHQGL
jgi:O-antigen biosynthesis protein